MFKNKKIENFSVGLFVLASLIVLAISAVSFSVFRTERLYGQKESRPVLTENQKDPIQRLFLKEDEGPVDPYTTKMPSLEYMLKGPIINSLDPSLGNIDSELNLVMFSDFECSYCAKQEKIVRELASAYDLRVIWKDFPYSDRSSRSYQAALAARCAQKENAFWQYHDLLFSGSYNLDRSGLMAIAEKIGLDIDDFSSCLDTAEKASLIDDNMAEAAALGIEGVPFIYINDQEVMGEISRGDLEKILKVEAGK